MYALAGGPNLCPFLEQAKVQYNANNCTLKGLEQSKTCISMQRKTKDSGRESGFYQKYDSLKSIFRLSEARLSF